MSVYKQIKMYINMLIYKQGNMYIVLVHILYLFTNQVGMISQKMLL